MTTVAQTQEASAIALAHKSSVATDTALNTLILAKEETQRGPFSIMFAMQKDFTEQDWSSFPVPGTETGNNPDYFKTMVPSTDGKTKTKTVSFWSIVADNRPMSVSLRDELAFIKRMRNPEAAKDGIPAEIKNGNPTSWKAREKYINGRLGTIRAGYKKGVALAFQFMAINALSGVEATPVFADGKDDEIENTTAPIYIFEPAKAGQPVKKWQLVSIGTFLKLNAAKASEKGGTYDALFETVARETRTTTSVVPMVKTIDTLEGTLAACAGYLDAAWQDKKQTDAGLFVKALSGPGSDPFLMTVMTLRNIFNDVVTRHPKMNQRYQELLATGELDDEVKAA